MHTQEVLGLPWDLGASAEDSLFIIQTGSLPWEPVQRTVCLLSKQEVYRQDQSEQRSLAAELFNI